MRSLLVALLAAATLLVTSACDDGCPEGKHRMFINVNNVTTSYCVND